MRRRLTPRPRSIDRRSVACALVFVGGTLGTAAREALALSFPSSDGTPYAIWAINIGGCLILGGLLGVLAGGTSGRHRGLRLAVGTGFCGGFTTYSALSLAGADLIGRGLAGSGIVYALSTLLVGAIAAWAGLALGTAAVTRDAPTRHLVTRRKDWVDPDVEDVPCGDAAGEATP